MTKYKMTVLDEERNPIGILNFWRLTEAQTAASRIVKGGFKREDSDGVLFVFPPHRIGSIRIEEEQDE